MIGQDRLQLGKIFEKAFDGALGQLGERLIARRENGERTLTLESVDKACGLDGSYEGLEGASRNSDINNISHYRPP
jgi:hypothetical protein